MAPPNIGCRTSAHWRASWPTGGSGQGAVLRARLTVEIEAAEEHLLARPACCMTVPSGSTMHALADARGSAPLTFTTNTWFANALARDITTSISRSRVVVRVGWMMTSAPEPRELARHLGEAAVEADREADAAPAGDVEGDEVVAGVDLLVGPPREELAIAGDDLARGRDGDGGVEECPSSPRSTSGRGRARARLAGEARRAGRSPGRGRGSRALVASGRRGLAAGACGEQQLGHDDEVDVGEEVAHRADLSANRAQLASTSGRRSPSGWRRWTVCA